LGKHGKVKKRRKHVKKKEERGKIRGKLIDMNIIRQRRYLSYHYLMVNELIKIKIIKLVTMPEELVGSGWSCLGLFLPSAGLFLPKAGLPFMWSRKIPL
jgi:hypothetical protein